MSSIDKNDTLADIVAEKRELAKKMRLGNPSLDEIEMAVNLEYDANRIEALWKREKAEIEVLALTEASRHKQGYNAAAMREALNKVGNAAAWIAESCNDQQTAKYMIDMIAIVQAALAAPPRNCDVGTPEEQAERMDAYCARYGERIGCSWRCDNCPLCSINRCDLVWAQMPYEAEEGDDK